MSQKLSSAAVMIGVLSVKSMVYVLKYQTLPVVACHNGPENHADPDQTAPEEAV